MTATTSSPNLVELRATLAMRSEDLRIARKHFDEAAARPYSPENVRAYDRAMGWLDACREREAAARRAVSRAARFDHEHEAALLDLDNGSTRMAREVRAAFGARNV